MKSVLMILAILVVNGLSIPRLRPGTLKTMETLFMAVLDS